MKPLTLALCAAALIGTGVFALSARRTAKAEPGGWAAVPPPPQGAGVAVVEAPVAAPEPTPTPVAVSPAPVEPLAFGAASLADTAAASTDPLAGWGPPPVPSMDPRRFSEAHWQGLEFIPKTPALSCSDSRTKIARSGPKQPIVNSPAAIASTTNSSAA